MKRQPAPRLFEAEDLPLFSGVPVYVAPDAPPPVPEPDAAPKDTWAWCGRLDETTEETV